MAKHQVCLYSLNEHHREWSINAVLCPGNYSLCFTPFIQIRVFTMSVGAWGDTITSSQRLLSLSEECAYKSGSPPAWGKKLSQAGEELAHSWCNPQWLWLFAQNQKYIIPSGAFLVWSLYDSEQHTHPNGHTLPIPRPLSFALILGWSTSALPGYRL